MILLSISCWLGYREGYAVAELKGKFALQDMENFFAEAAYICPEEWASIMASATPVTSLQGQNV
jgi:hypothetical protein